MRPEGGGICGGPCTRAGGAASAWHAVTSGLPWPPWPPRPSPGPDRHPQPPSPTRVRGEPRAQTRRLEGTCSDTWFSGLPWKHTEMPGPLWVWAVQNHLTRGWGELQCIEPHFKVK